MVLYLQFLSIEKWLKNDLLNVKLVIKIGVHESQNSTPGTNIKKIKI